MPDRLSSLVMRNSKDEKVIAIAHNFQGHHSDLVLKELYLWEKCKSEGLKS